MILLPVLASLAVFAAQIPAQHLPKPPAGDTVLAKVDGVEIKASEVESILWDWRGAEVTQDLVTFQLIRAEFHRQKMSVTEIEVLKKVDDTLAKIKETLPAGKDVQLALREQGFPMSRLYLSVKSDMLLERLAEKEFDPKKFIRVSTMVFMPKGETEADMADAMKRGTEAFDRLAKGETWDAVLTATQENAGLLAAKGMLGWRGLDLFPASTQTEFATAKVGGVTQPVQTGGGVQIFRVESHGADATGESLLDLKKSYLEDAKETILQRLRDKGKVDLLFK